MTYPRFLVAELPSHGGRIVLPEAQAKHLRAVRLAQGDLLVLTDGRGDQQIARIMLQTREHTEVELLDDALELRESPFRLNLCIALLKGEKLDWVIEKGTELGVARFTLVECDNSLGGASANKLARWQRLAEAAVEQSQRAALPAVTGPMTLPDLAVHADRPTLCLVFSEGDAEPSLETVLPNEADECWALVGPEGGFTAEELNFLASHGWLRARLGPRILRAETASIAAAATLQARFGDLRTAS